MATGQALTRSNNEEKKLKPIPTTVKLRLGATNLRKNLGATLRSIKEQDIVAVTLSGNESMAIVREQFLFEMINLCNTLLYDQMDHQIKAPATKEERLARLEKSKQELAKLLKEI